MKRKTISLHIEELTLRGFPKEDRHLIGEAIEKELARLLTEGGLPPALARGGEMGRLDGGSFKTARGEKAEAIGARVAQKVYGGITGGGK